MFGLQISGKASQYFNLAMTIIMVVGALGGSAFPDYVPSWLANDIVKTFLFAGAIFTGVNTVLHGAGGPGIAPPVAKAIAIGIIAALGVALLNVGPVSAAEIKLKSGGGHAPAPAVIVDQATAQTVSTLTGIAAVAAQVVADLQSADSVAGAINPATNQPYDALGHMCFPAAASFIQGLPSPATIPSPSGAGGLITAVEVTRINALLAEKAIVNIAITGYPDSLKIACDPWILDNVAQVGNATAAITLFLGKLLPAVVK